jgi:hypothetical protein
LGGTSDSIEGREGRDATAALVEEGFKTVDFLGSKDGFLDGRFFSL